MPRANGDAKLSTAQTQTAATPSAHVQQAAAGVAKGAANKAGAGQKAHQHYGQANGQACTGGGGGEEGGPAGPAVGRQNRAPSRHMIIFNLDDKNKFTEEITV